MLSNNVESIGGMGGYGGGFGGGFGGGNLIEGLLFGALLGNRGGLFGGNNNGADVVAPTLGYQAGVLAGENAKYRDVVDAQTALTAAGTASQNDITAQLYATQNDINTNINAQSAALTNYMDVNFDRVANVSRTGAEQILGRVENGFTAGAVAICGVKDAISSSAFASAMQAKDASYNSLLQAKDAQAQLAECCCSIKQTVKDDGEVTRALITSNLLANKNDEIQRLNTLNDFNSRGLFPATGPTVSVIQNDPCRDRRHDNDNSGEHIKIVNQNVNALGSTVAQLAAAVQALINKSA